MTPLLQEHYLNMRGFDVSNTSSSNQFVPKLLESQAFALFIQDNGPPFRRLHIFDEVGSVLFFNSAQQKFE